MDLQSNLLGIEHTFVSSPWTVLAGDVCILGTACGWYAGVCATVTGCIVMHGNSATGKKKVVKRRKRSKEESGKEKKAVKGRKW